jgi:hypothetical protein
MGIFSILVGLLLACFLPDSVQRPKSFFLPNFKSFTPRELHILRHRVLLDDPTKFRPRTHISTAALKKAVREYYITYWISSDGASDLQLSNWLL